VNSSSLSGLFGKNVKKTAERIVKKGLCNFIATDAHSTGRRAPRLKEGFEFIQKNDEKIYRNIDENTQMLLENVDIVCENEEIKEIRVFFQFYSDNLIQR
jgi:protein-tyrosine phosphatase